MIWHPQALAVWTGDLLALAIGCDAVRRLIMALPQWDPASGDRLQLLRERSLELAAFQGLWVFMFQAGSLVVFLLGCSNVWSAIVPGAMCGTGVLQAMGAYGNQTLLFRTAALLVLFAWWTASRIDRHHPEGPLRPFMGRLFLLGFPLMLLGIVTWGRAVAAVDPAKAVDCCAVVYAAATRHAPPVPLDTGPGGHQWIAVCLAGAALIAAAGLVRWKHPTWGGPWVAILLGCFTMGWVWAAVQALRFGFGPYIYEVLQHPCPWCLFLPEHGGVGVVLFGALAVVCLEQTAAGVSAVIARSQPDLRDAAMARLRTTQWRTAAAVIVFCTVSAAPVIRWRIHFGGWML